VTITAGELGVFNDDNLGGAAIPITFSGGVLQVRSPGITNIDSHPINNGTFNGGFDVFDAGNTFTFNQSVSGSGAMRKLGAGTLVLTASNAYTGGTTVSGGTLAISNSNNIGAESSSITLNGGVLTTTAPITSTRVINLGASGGTFDTQGNDSTFAAVISGSGTFTKRGGNTLTINGIRTTASLQLTEGLLKVSPGRDANNKVSKVTSIGFNGGKLDLGENDLIIDYSSAAAASQVLIATFNELSNSFNNGWNSNSGAITSSAAAAASGSGHPTALGYAEASTLGTVGASFKFDNINTDAQMLLVRYTYSGDANLDGRVNALDFNRLAVNFGKAVPPALLWANGDFNYDNVVDSTDFSVLANNFNLQLLPGESLGALVPEPTSLTMAVGIGAAALVSRRRRRS
jgi:autotransporter-associated beta strand protein